jgi:HemY protein
LDAFQWRVPVETLEKSGNDLVLAKLEELLAISAPPLESASVDVDVASEAGAPAGDDEARPAPAGRAAAARASAVDADAVTIRPAAATRTAQKGRSEAVAAEAAANTVPDGDTNGDPVVVLNGQTASTGPANGTPKAGVRRSEPTIYVTPHAPDDPGPDEPEPVEEEAYPPRTYRTVKR